MNLVSLLVERFRLSVFDRSYLLLIGATFLVLFPLLFNDFAQRSGDDNWMLYENTFIRSLQWDNVTYYFTHFYTGQYSPVNTLYYSLIYQLFRLEPFWYHFFSLVLHLLNAMLVYVFIRRLLGVQVAVLPLKLAEDKVRLIAFATALLFAVHPMQVESVAWISASKNLLYTFFSLLVLLQYMRYASTHSWWAYSLVLVFYLLAFGSKEQAAILPANLLLVDWYTGRNMRKRSYWLSVLPFFVFAAGMGIISLQAQDAGFATRLANEYYPLWQRLVLACYAFTEYIYKGLLPIKLNYMYSFPMKPGEAMPLVFWFYPVVVLCFGLLLAYAWRRGWRSLFFGLGFLTINLALALHIVPLARGVLVADRYFYMGSIGLFFIVCRYLLGQDKYSFSRIRLDPRLLIGIYVLYLGVFAWRYAVHWT